MTNVLKDDEARMTSDDRSPNALVSKQLSKRAHRHSDFVSLSSLGVRHSSFRSDLIATDAGLSELLKKIEAADRVGIDIEADSLHSYREKLCLLQISVPTVAGIVDAGSDLGPTSHSRDHPPSRSYGGTSQSGLEYDVIVDPLADVDVDLLRQALESREIVLHGSDYDLRMLRRGLSFISTRIFDTVIAARLLGMREFSLGALVKLFFGVELHKHSQKANWALRPLPPQMIRYALNDVHYLLPLAAKLGEELDRVQRREWFRQCCQRAIES